MAIIRAQYTFEGKFRLLDQTQERMPKPAVELTKVGGGMNYVPLEYLGNSGVELGFASKIELSKFNLSIGDEVILLSNWSPEDLKSTR